MISRPTRWYQWLLLGSAYLAIPLLILRGLALIDGPTPIPQDAWISKVEWVASMDDTPPVDGWQAIDLDEGSPELPEAAQAEPFTSVWYRFANPRADELAAVFVYSPNANLAVWYQGELQKLTGPMTLPLPYVMNPVVVPLAPAAGNPPMVALRVARFVSATRMPWLAVVPLRDAQAAEQTLLNIWVRLPVFLMVIMCVILTFVFVLYIVNRTEAAYAWAALTMLIWLLHSAHAQIENVWFYHNLWFSFSYVLVSWAVTELIFLNRFFELPMPRTERWVVIVTLCLLALLLGSAVLTDFYTMSFLGSVVFAGWCLVIAMLVSARYFVAIHRSWSFESVSLWLVSGVVLVVAIRDILFQFYGNDLLPGSTFYLQFVAIIPLLVFGIHLVRRFSTALKTASLRNQELDALVEARTLELKESARALAQQEERARLMREMHDGLGGQLVQAVALSERGADPELEQSLRLALEDLRLIVDSLSPTNDDLGGLFASFRHRSARALERAGFWVRWELASAALDQSVTPQQGLNLLRVLQEAVTNALRHSEGSELTVRLLQQGKEVTLEVEDNGVGYRAGSEGRGLGNMRVRARELGGALTLTNLGSGTLLRCTFPT